MSSDHISRSSPRSSWVDRDFEACSLDYWDSSWPSESCPPPTPPLSSVGSIRSTRTDTSLSQKLAPHWIEQNFQKRECSEFLPTTRDPQKCGCGRVISAHLPSAIATSAAASREDGIHRWTISRNTISLPTDAFGTIEFQGGPHPHKAQYVRLGFDSNPEDILRLFENVWGIKPPKLLITVHGGIANFSLQPKLARVFRKGLLKAAKTTGAWIITSGINAGVVRQVAAALGDSGSSRTRSRIITIGIAPWGLLKKREDLVGKDGNVPYHPQALSPKGKFAVLNDKHSYFLLVDNGTIGRYGADIILRKRFEEYISKRTIEGVTKGGHRKKIPVVCVVLEGGTCTIRAVLDYVTNSPPVPVVVCDGSGRAADLLAFAHNYIQDGGSLPDDVKPQLLSLVQEVFGYNNAQAEKVILELQLCVRKKHLVTVFRLGEDSQQDVDHAILTALLKGQGYFSPPDQLGLALAWNRVDIARTDIFVLGQEWPPGALEAAMMEALIEDRVDFVKLLLENGVSMEKFLTAQRLEELYNTDKGPQNTLKFLLRDVVPRMGSNYRCSLREIGLVIEQLMGSAYSSTYTSREFQNRVTDKKFLLLKKLRTHVIPIVVRPKIVDKTDEECVSTSDAGEPDFHYPFNDLMLWAVLTKRQEMARTMWQHGEEALAKALLASKLFKSMAHEAAEDFLEMEICVELKKNSEEFRKLALELLEHAYLADDELTLQLLTYELRNWGRQTCLSLAVMGNNKEFLAHPCCQILLADLWHGGMRIRKNVNLKVLAGILCPPYVLSLEFKTKEELLLQPQTAEEHAEDLRWDESSESDSDAGSDIPDSDLEIGNYQVTAMDRRKSGDNKLSRASSRTSLSSNFVGRMASFKIKRPNDNEMSKKRTDPMRRSFDPYRLKKQDSVHSGPANHRQDNGSEKSSENMGTLKKRSGSLTGSLPNVRQQAVVLKRSKPQSLSVRRKLYEFYVAPVTTFWSFTLSYFVFLFTFTYVVLVKTPSSPDGVEIFIISYVATMGLDQIRRAVGFKQKVKLFVQRTWNWTTTLAVLMFFVAFVLRWSPETLAWGRVLYCSNIIFWYLRILDLMSVNSQLGPYITMVGKMMVKMIYIIIILLVVLVAFGTARQSILYPAEEWHWLLVRNILYKPYFMLYGEVYAGEIDTCGDKGQCVTGDWLTPIYMAIFLVVANILLINLLIAVFNNIFNETNAVAHQMWRFQRYEQVMEYESSPSLPPPLVIVSHCYLLLKYCCKRRTTTRQKHTFDISLKLFLDQDDIEKIHDFEEECMDDLHREKEFRKLVSSEERIRRTADRVEFMSMKMSDIAGKEYQAKTGMVEMERRVQHVEETLNTIRIQQENMLDVVMETQKMIHGHFLHRATPPAPLVATPTLPLPPLPVVFPALDRNKSSSPTKELRVIREGRTLSSDFKFGESEDDRSGEPSVSRSRSPETNSSACDTPLSPLSPSMPRQKLKLKRSRGGGTGVRNTLPVISPESMVASVMVSNDSDSSAAASPHPIARRNRKRTLTMETAGEPSSSQDYRSWRMERASSVPNESPPKKDPHKGGSYSPHSPTKDLLHPLYSCPPSFHSRFGHSIRRRPNGEYTSITDTIQIGSGELSSSPVRNGALEVGPPPSIPKIEVVDTDTPTNTADDALRRAHPSFVVKQNEMLKEFEETGSRITGGLIDNRIRRQSMSICPASNEDLKDMGLNDLDIREYLDCLANQSLSRTSSQESLNSNRLEDAEGFQQINECLIQQQIESAQKKGSVLNRASLEPFPLMRKTSSTPPTSSHATPATTPGSKAGQIFTFDAQDLKDYMKQVEQEDEIHKLSKPLDEEEE